MFRFGQIDRRSAQTSKLGMQLANLQIANQAPVLSIASCSETNSIVAGTELLSHQAIVAFW